MSGRILVAPRQLVPVVVAVGALVALLSWWTWAGRGDVIPRLPGTDRAPDGDGASGANPVLAGKLIAGTAFVTPGPAGSWPGFRGPARTGISIDPTPLARTWPGGGPPALWAIDVGEGYGGVAVGGGRVYLMDYDRDAKQSALRCLALADGHEVWRFAYPLAVKRNHGMTRTVPALAGNLVVAMDPKCNVLAVDAATGELRWSLNLTREFGATVPPWYTGQCPLIDGDQVVLAPAGPAALFVAVDLATGKTRWKTPNPRGWKMTHSSVMPMTWAGRRMYVYCGSGGVAGAAAADGALLWDTTDWKISIATVPSPLVLDDGRVFLSGGYNAGSLMLQLKDDAGKITATTAFRLPPETFGATQHTPVAVQGRILGIRPNGHFVCLDAQGKVVWSSGAAGQFGLGSFLLTPGLGFALNDSGVLSLFEPGADKFNLIARAPVLKGRESWGPMALAGGRLLVRDLTQLICLDVAAR